ncbi:histidine kinase [Polaribacter reichenbachii]|uniref:Histidine kinase n=1 Tax=Polaribacter reichenbachii TaxID=996801 RepID=A0A1B8U484_9FLAO|nr:histidine kinase [Polaribacter reichenbachii]APZ47413.1 histidine kinase [Polaribacter reichenbachii]AUC18052.1 histidine kinase [Polaribacter reichenbachii]OBY66662.1 histidine kinase [Polaribacter reichenbachii]
MIKNKNITLLSHILVWFVLFSMPYLLSYGQEQELDRVIIHFWIPLLLSSILFYLNYFLLIDKYLFTKKTVWFVLINIIFIVFFIYIKESIEDVFFQNITRNRPSSNKNSTGPPFKMFIYIQMVSYMAPLLFSIVVKTTKRWVKTEAERKEAINFKLQSELQHLHYQLQPHFFFNSLNNIYAMVDLSPEQAKKSIHSLSKLMRYMLYETNEESISLTKEIDFMKKYIELMKLRVSDKTTIDYSFPKTETSIQIAPLLFISLIENAFKHGVAASKPSSINMNMTCTNKTVLFTIENTNFPKKSNDKSGSGIGLQNLEKRLQLLYPDKYIFQTEVILNRFVVNLEIETI